MNTYGYGLIGKRKTVAREKQAREKQEEKCYISLDWHCRKGEKRD
jgi:hypothetical protein